MNDLIQWAIKENRITKEECKIFIKRKNELRRELESKRVKA